jgi:hypothetical protein
VTAKLLAQLTMQGVSHANAVAVGRKFLEAIEGTLMWIEVLAPRRRGHAHSDRG